MRQREREELTVGQTDGERERERQTDITYTCPMPSCSEVLSLGFPQTSVPVFFNGQHSKKEGKRERAGEYHTIINK